MFQRQITPVSNVCLTHAVPLIGKKYTPLNIDKGTLVPSLRFNEPDANEDPYNMLFCCLLCLYFGPKKCT